MPVKLDLPLNQYVSTIDNLSAQLPSNIKISMTTLGGSHKQSIVRMAAKGGVDIRIHGTEIKVTVMVNHLV